MMDLKILIKKRGTIKASISRINTFVDSFDSGVDDHHALKIKLRNLAELEKKYDEIQSQIELEDNESVSDDRVHTENELCKIECKLNALLDKFVNLDKLNSSQSSNNAIINTQIQLPPIKLPRYNGNVLEWTHYFHMFHDLVHSRHDLTNIQKMHYLHSSLKDEALNTIKSLPITNENYSVALELLRDRFDNNLVISAHHIQNILKINNIEKETLSDISGFIDKISATINALQAMNLPVNVFELIVTQFLTDKLDAKTSKLWKEKLSSDNLPNYQEFMEFLRSRRQLLENTSIHKEQSHKIKHNKPQTRFTVEHKSKPVNCYTNIQRIKCTLCKSEHNLYSCKNFIGMNINERKSFLIKNNCCLNCLRSGHSTSDCRSKNVCKTCSKKHHTLIHTVEANPIQNANDTYCALKLQTNKKVLLSTAVCDAADRYGNFVPCRILLDSGSQANFCTLNFARKLGLTLTKNHLPISGINNSSCRADFSVTFKLHSRYENFNFNVQCAVLPSLTDNLPSESFNSSQLGIPPNLYLADPDFNISSSIDVLLGAQFYLHLIKPLKFIRGQQFPVIQESRLGYILAGNLPHRREPNSTVSSFMTRCDNKSLSSLVEKFWQIEEIPNNNPIKQDSICEKHFSKTTTRNEQGRFVVSLPRTAKNIKLGDSYNNALQRFQKLEHKFKQNPSLKMEYYNFIQEYLELGHMTPLNHDDLSVPSSNTFYLPHHAVIKESSLTTKLRVVFDGSAKTTNGLSLNDTLLVGPTVQQDLFSILLRFRLHNFIIMSDITKMYRQVLVNPLDSNLQRILWRDSPAQELKHFALRTVTYGTASASFLATRCLIQIAKDNQTRYPKAADSIKNDFYVDDIITGSDNLEETKRLKSDITELLKQYGFPFHQWFSNSKTIVPSDSDPFLSLNKNENVRTLGILWNNGSDRLMYEFKQQHKVLIYTKRKILSVVAGIYDPLGLTGPIIFLCKHFVQQLWQANLSWDDELPDSLSSRWADIYNQLQFVSHINIQRCIKRNDSIVKTFQIHGFADASTKGYACCIYIRVTYDNSDISCHLLCSKSRVAPLKQISLPRLELCACLLLARLYDKVIHSLNKQIDATHLYSDSTIALHWIHGQSNNWKTFVANRVSEIQQLTNNTRWFHVRSDDNPADILSRGCSPSDLLEMQKWWHGPHWLIQNTAKWPCQDFNKSYAKLIPECEDERRSPVHMSMFIKIDTDYSKRFSSLHKLIRVFSYCLRFCHNAKLKSADRNNAPLSTVELKNTLHIFIRLSQQMYFSSELSSLQGQRFISKQSKIASLNPFIDNEGMLRVGGRLQQSNLSYDSKHQLILHPHANIAQLIIHSEHLRLLHAGVQLTQFSLRQRYWILRDKLTIRSIIRKCSRCFRFSAKKQTQLLGQLPSPRITPSKPFAHSAVDYGGPVIIRHGGQRSKTLSKSYIALFICLSTKAIHLELVSDLSSEAFLAAFRRFISRRGLPIQIFSDNGTNFRHANNILHDLFKLFNSEGFKNVTQSFFSAQGINWSFIPPSSPHFGGLWESGIKSVKFHLRRVIGQTILNFEELYTVLTQIEACLNSRPLCAMSNDSNDPEPLTPSHFLVGSPLTAIPDPNLDVISNNRLGRWQLLQKFTQSIWKKWSRDYLNQLQQRNKWRFPQRNLSVGDLVLICEDGIPPLCWRSGIVMDTFAGSDNLVRVVEVRTPYGTFRRPIHKLALLPMSED